MPNKKLVFELAPPDANYELEGQPYNNVLVNLLTEVLKAVHAEDDVTAILESALDNLEKETDYCPTSRRLHSVGAIKSELKQIAGDQVRVIVGLSHTRGVEDKLDDIATWKVLILEEAEASVAASADDEERLENEAYATQLRGVAARIVS